MFYSLFHSWLNILAELMNFGMNALTRPLLKHARHYRYVALPSLRSHVDCCVECRFCTLGDRLFYKEWWNCQSLDQYWYSTAQTFPRIPLYCATHLHHCETDRVYVCMCVMFLKTGIRGTYLSTTLSCDTCTPHFSVPASASG